MRPLITSFTVVEQECIPVGCVPAARRPYAGVCFRGGGFSLPGGAGGGVLPAGGGFSLLGGFSLPGGSPCQGGVLPTRWGGGFSLPGGGSPCWGGLPVKGGRFSLSRGGGFSLPDGGGGSPCQGGFLPARGGSPENPPL